MIASAHKLRTQILQEKFLDLLPSIRNQAQVAFRNEKPERRDELIAEVIANCWVAFTRLMDRGLEDVIYPTPLAQYAIRQARDGRKVGANLNINDVSSPYAQKAKGIFVESLDRFNQRKNEWKEVLVEDRHAGPAETAASRIDVGDWFQSLPRKTRKVAQTLASGETTKKTARRFRVTPGRISQMRREFQESWTEFHGEPAFA